MLNLSKSEIKIPIDEIGLNGILQIPQNAKKIAIFAHGSGSGRFSVRNQQVAQVFNQAQMATLLFDLLTEEEEALDELTREHRFNIPLLTSRLMAVTDWLLKQPALRELKIGYFGASTGAAAILQAAAEKQDLVKALVSRGGRPDLAGRSLAQVKAPTLLIVGAEDPLVIEINQKAMQSLSCVRQLEIIPGASHLFEEPGTLDQVACLAREWFMQYLN